MRILGRGGRRRSRRESLEDYDRAAGFGASNASLPRAALEISTTAMDIESPPRRFTKEGPFETFGRRARNPPKKSRDGAAAARDRSDGERTTRPRDRTHTRANTRRTQPSRARSTRSSSSSRSRRARSSRRSRRRRASRSRCSPAAARSSASSSSSSSARPNWCFRRSAWATRPTPP